VVYVPINYRLGIFGFFAHPELTQESPHNTLGLPPFCGESVKKVSDNSDSIRLAESN
jgi:carboxylesterase type B